MITSHFSQLTFGRMMIQDPWELFVLQGKYVSSEQIPKAISTRMEIYTFPKLCFKGK